MMSKGIDLKQAKLKDLNTILQMQKEAFAELFDKYQDTETSPATKITKKSCFGSINPKRHTIS